MPMNTLDVETQPIVANEVRKYWRSNITLSVNTTVGRWARQHWHDHPLLGRRHRWHGQASFAQTAPMFHNAICACRPIHAVSLRGQRCLRDAWWATISHVLPDCF